LDEAQEKEIQQRRSQFDKADKKDFFRTSKKEPASKKEQESTFLNNIKKMMGDQK